MPKSYNSNLIIANRSYTTEKICTLYKKQKLHPQTVRDWVNIEGLQVLSNKPILIDGAVLRQFIKTRNESYKTTLKFSEFKCLKCKTIGEPQNKEVAIYYNKNGSIRVVGMCSVCPAEMHRIYKSNTENELQEVFLIKPVLMTLCNSSCSPLQTNIKTNEEALQNECEIEGKSGAVLTMMPKTDRQTIQESGSGSVNLNLQTNIPKEQKPSHTNLHTNISQEFQQQSLFNF